MQRLVSDVLIVGAGGAGLAAALSASATGASVLVVNKGPQPEASTTNVAGGVSAVISTASGDSRRQHFADTITAGQFLNDQRLVHLMVEEVGGALEGLQRLGCQFDLDDEGNVRQLSRGGHSFPRLCVRHGDRGGREILRTMVRKLRGGPVRILNLVHLHRLLLGGSGVNGAVALDVATGEPLLLEARAVVLATGGSARLYPMSSLPAGINGDGYILGLDAGAELVDMEMVQFHPGGMCLPGVYQGISGSEPSHYAAMGGRLLNAEGERFMERYDPRLESATRDVVSRSEYLEIRAGRGGPRGGVYLDLEGLAPEARTRVKETNPRLYDSCLKAGLDITRGDRVEMAPTLHYLMGGIRIGEDGATAVPGLYACGEVAGGIHGANRIAGNALADLLVFGCRAGVGAAGWASSRAAPKTVPLEATRIAEEIVRPLAEDGPGALRPLAVERSIQQVMWQHVSLARSRDGLLAAREELSRIRHELLPAMAVGVKTRTFNLEWLRYLEAPGLLKLAEAVTESALLRQESRGAHFREDFPSRDDDIWLANLILRSRGSGFETRLERVQMRYLRPER